ncbi:MAG: hypothetical protein QME14_09185 [Methanobacteriaceae archaeon]|nr:hypothetical protein [Methanobacteriaceae archaeon]
MIDEIKTAHIVKDEQVNIYAKFEIIDTAKSKEEIEDFYDRTKKFAHHLSSELGIEVDASVIPDFVMQFPDSNLWIIEVTAVISVSEDYQEEIDKIKQNLKEIILRDYSKFY